MNRSPLPGQKIGNETGNEDSPAWIADTLVEVLEGTRFKCRGPSGKSCADRNKARPQYGDAPRLLCLSCLAHWHALQAQTILVQIVQLERIEAGEKAKDL